jgi:hypothetical protein
MYIIGMNKLLLIFVLALVLAPNVFAKNPKSVPEPVPVLDSNFKSIKHSKPRNSSDCEPYLVCEDGKVIVKNRFSDCPTLEVKENKQNKKVIETCGK